jgi:hypothetical protein
VRQRQIELSRKYGPCAQVDLLSPLGLSLVQVRLSTRLFLWLADHCPRLAEAWAFRRR